MAGKKGKKHAGTVLERAVRRFEKMRAYSNVAKRVGRWIENETTVVAKQKLVELRDKLEVAASTHEAILTGLKELQAGKYSPPKKSFSGTIKLETGKHVWIKPAYRAPYAATYDDVVLDDLFVDTIIENKVRLSIGDPSKNSATMKLLVSKSILQANAPGIEEAAA